MAVAKRPLVSVSGNDKKRDDPAVSSHDQDWDPESQAMAMSTPKTIGPGQWQPNSNTKHANRQLRRSSLLFRKRRVLLLLVVLTLVYLFVKYIPTDVPSVGQRIDVRTGRHQGRPFADPVRTENSPGPESALVPYDGPVKFYNLASSLRRFNHPAGNTKDHVVLVLFDLQSTATVLSTACSILQFNRTNVHIALLAMHDVQPESLVQVNNLPSACAESLIWHDARPDHNAASTPARQDIVVASALSHIHASLRFPVLLLDQHQASITRLKTTIAQKLSTIGSRLLIIPDDPTALAWTHSLDARALATLPDLQIDIVVSPYKHSAGSLVRLLDSIRRANYATLPIPRVIVNLPQGIDPHARAYLDHFRFFDSDNRLVLRRMLDPTPVNPSRASLNVLESFYPPSYPFSQVLVLSPDFELDPNFLQSLFLATLEYKYATSSIYTGTLAGISLQNLGKSISLHQRPSTAMLYFGDKWVELQDYVTLRLARDETLKRHVDREVWIEDVSAFMHLSSEWMRARGFWTLNTGFDLGHVHAEATQIPEEYWKEKDSQSKIPVLTENTVLAGVGDKSIIHDLKTGVDFLNKMIDPVTGLLPADGLPLISASGETLTSEQALAASTSYRDNLSLDVGGCKQLSERFEGPSVDSLFCKIT